MTLSKSWSLREGGGNSPSKPIRLGGPLFSGKMSVTGETIIGCLFLTTEAGSWKACKAQYAKVSLVFIYWGVTRELKYNIEVGLFQVNSGLGKMRTSFPFRPGNTEK